MRMPSRRSYAPLQPRTSHRPDSRSVPLGTSFEHRPEIGAGTLRFEPRRVGCIAKAEIAVDQAKAMVALGRDARRVKGVGISLALVAQGIEPRRANGRRRQPGKAGCTQGRNAPVRAMLLVVQVMAAEPFHDRA